MKLVSYPEDLSKGWSRREIRLQDTILKKAFAFQISQLTLSRQEQSHSNKKGYVLCIVISGWMSVQCNKKIIKRSQGQGIIFEPGDDHRILKGNGWMLSAASCNYHDLKTIWKDTRK